MRILAIESSCDDTSAAVVENSKVLSNIISSQYFHTKYGGIIPELASRSHIQVMSKVVMESLNEAGLTMNDIDALAVTTEPGLVGSLIVGSNFAKGLSIRYNLPIVPVNHIEGHLFSGGLQSESIKFPFISLVVSGGHTAIFKVNNYNTYDILGLTKDDAAGEAFDKTAKLLGLSYPGGPEIDKLAKSGNPRAYDFPRSMLNSGDYNFSYSGLKTSVKYFIQREFPNGVPESRMPDIAASVQKAIVEVLVKKTITAAKEHNVCDIVIAGGVSANSLLRKDMAESALKKGITETAPQMSYCMDNAAMIGFIASKKLEEAGCETFHNLEFTVNATALRAKRK